MYQWVTVSLHPSRLKNLNVLSPPVNPQYNINLITGLSFYSESARGIPQDF
jgi:hypothetical protein